MYSFNKNTYMFNPTFLLSFAAKSKKIYNYISDYGNLNRIPYTMFSGKDWLCREITCVTLFSQWVIVLN